MENKKIGKYLQEKRKENDMTQSDLAKKLNVTYQAVSRWETGESIPDITTLNDLADLYQVSIDEILQRNHTSVSTNANDDEILPIFLMVIVFLHAVGFAIFSGLNYFDFYIIGLVIYFIFAAAGLFMQHLGLIVKNPKTKRDIIFYLLCFVPVLISILLVLRQINFLKLL